MHFVIGFQMRVSGNASLKNTLWEPLVYFSLSMQVTSQMLQSEMHKEQINDLCNNAKFHRCFHTGCFIPSLVFSPTLSKLIRKKKCLPKEYGQEVV